MGGDQACRTMNIVPEILADMPSEPIEIVTPLSSPVHQRLRDSVDDLLLDSSADAVEQEVSEYANKSIHVAWEGSTKERRVWLRKQCDVLFALMNEGESYPSAQEDVNAYMQELLKMGEEYFDRLTTRLFVLEGVQVMLGEDELSPALAERWSVEGERRSMEGEQGELQQGAPASRTVGTRTEGAGGVIRITVELVLEHSAADGSIAGMDVRYAPAGPPAWCSLGRPDRTRGPPRPRVAAASLVLLSHCS